MVIGGYFIVPINDYLVWLLVAILLCLLMIILIWLLVPILLCLLVPILLWILVIILLVVIGGYFISGYWWVLY